MTSFQHLPQEVYLFLREYFISLSIEPYKQQGFRSWRNFLNCNRKIFGDVKKYCVLFNLKPKYSVLYLASGGHSNVVSDVSSLGFLDHLQKKCLNPELQIMLSLTNGHCAIRDTTSSFYLHFSSSCRCSEERKPSVSVYGLTFSGYNSLTSFSSFIPFSSSSSLTYLNFSNCKSLVDISCVTLFSACKIIKLCCCSSIRDFSALSNCLEVDLSYTMIEDLTCLKNAKKVIATACSKIVDVSPLVNAVYVDLSMCQGIIDVSSLKNVKRLILVSCLAIEDVSMLGNVISLDLSLCRKDLDISCLKSVPNFLYFQVPF
jgi:hypothetical protein